MKMEAEQAVMTGSVSSNLSEKTADEIQPVHEEQSSSGASSLQSVSTASTLDPTSSSSQQTVPDILPESVKQRIEYRHIDTNDLVHSFELNEKNGFGFHHRVNPSVFEIVTSYRTSDKEFKPSTILEQEEGKKATPFVADLRNKVTMVIHSQAIIHALRSVVEYYPGQDLLQTAISIPEPYPILVHHREKLSDFMEKCNPATLTAPLCTRETKAYDHLKILLEFLDKTVMSAVREEQERNEKGFYTWDMLWLKWIPGATMRIPSDLELPTEGVIESIKDGALGFRTKEWEVNFWSLDYDGKWLGVKRSNFYLIEFDGERTLSSSARKIIDETVFQEPPDKEARSGESTKEQDRKNTEVESEEAEVKGLIDEGKTYFDLLAEKCQYCNGNTVDFPFRKIEGLVMVDLRSYYSRSGAPSVDVVGRDETIVDNCTCVVCKGRANKTKSSPFAKYPNIVRRITSLTKHQYFLLPKTIWVFVFKTRNWERVSVRDLSEPTFHENMIDTLVMDTTRLQTIKALAGSYIRENRHGEKTTLPPWSADFIQGKGQGQIFLLHGKPGVGKTYTAECIAQYTKRPLLVLTSSDIGTKPEEIEKILLEQFKRATSWGAILLIDEADVFMEQRSTNDLTRNSLVAGFLRALEFYEGILFLTTNRVGTFDDAFISRIHVQLYYQDFTDDERQRVWRTFMDKLISERGKSIRVSIDAKEYIRGNEIKAVKWNGREIRNAFQTAVALAEYEAEKDEEGKILLKDSHISAIVKMSKDFKNYLDDLHQANEGKRAQMLGLRLDDEK